MYKNRLKILNRLQKNEKNIRSPQGGGDFFDSHCINGYKGVNNVTVLSSFGSYDELGLSTKQAINPQTKSNGG